VKLADRLGKKIESEKERNYGVEEVLGKGKVERIRTSLKVSLTLAAIFLTLTGCGARRLDRRPRTIPPPVPVAVPSAIPSTARIIQNEKGIASWYGDPFHGRRTANGEIYDMYNVSAAHKTLPFGTEVMVNNLKNGQRIKVRINDRGPFVKGRIIDLSYAAAQAINMSGIAPVHLQILKLPPQTRYSVQVGSFKMQRNAVQLQSKLRRAFSPVFVEPFNRGDQIFYRVRVGEIRTVTQAKQLKRKLQRRRLKPFIVTLDWRGER